MARIEEKFWDFSLKTYAKTGVADACLALQDEHKVDVNVLLFCCWYGIYFGKMDAALANQVWRFSSTWTAHVVRPLREVRRWLKTEDSEGSLIAEAERLAYRERVKVIELGAEKIEQDGLRSLVKDSMTVHSMDQQAAQVVFNLAQYFHYLEVSMDNSSAEPLRWIIDAIFPNIPSNKRDNILVEVLVK